jgi:hypothetical protein
MMGRQRRDQGRLFYGFRLEDRIPENHLLRRINVFVTVALADLHKELERHYSEIGRPSVDPELMIRMLIVGYGGALPTGASHRVSAQIHVAKIAREKKPRGSEYRRVCSNFASNLASQFSFAICDSGSRNISRFRN